MNDNSDDRLRSAFERSAPQLSPDLVTGASARPAPHLANNRRRLGIAGGALVAVAAVTVGALVITSPTQQQPLFAAVASGQSENSPMSSAAGDSRLMAWTSYEYVAGDGLSTDTGSGHVYQLERTGTADATLRAAAAAFGLTGEPAKSAYYDAAYPTYVIGAEDGSAPSVVVTWAGTGDWWYNDPAAYGSNTACVADPVDPAICVTPEPSPNLAPSADEARTLAQGIFAETGFDVDAADIRVTADDWQTTASANLVVDGTATAIEWSIGWGTTGDISYAYGHSVDVVDKGSYGTVSATDSVARLNDWRWFGSAGPDYQTGMNILAADGARAMDGATTDVVTEGPTDAPTDVPSDTPTSSPGDPGTEPAPDPTLVEPTPIDPAPVEPVEPEPVPTPETVTVTVTEAHETLLLLWDSEGNAWLVPGFAMPHPDGWWNTVVSLVDGIITLPEPVAIEPYAVDGTMAN